MQNEPPIVQIEFTPDFRQALRKLKRRYRSIETDIQLVLRKIEVGRFAGDRLEAGAGYFVYKVRVQNRDIRKGKSAGYRLIYQVESPTNVLLLTIYSKADQDDISLNRILKILSEFYDNN